MNSSKNPTRPGRPSPSPDAETLSQWLDERASGCLDPAHLEVLEACLAADPALAQEAQFAQRFEGVMREARVEVRPSFLEAVMSALSESRRSEVRAQAPLSAWRLVAAVLAVTVGGALLLGAVTGPSSGLSPLAAVADFFVTSGVAAGGLLGASWEGLSTSVGAWVRASVLNMVLFGGIVVALNLLLVSLVRSRRRARATVSDR
jgi:hypothetical protein